MTAGQPFTLGVAGAGTMGSGIAQLAGLAGVPTTVHDPDPDALRSGLDKVRAGLARGAERGRWTDTQAEEAAARIGAAATLDGLARCDLIIEAAPESLQLKRALFARLSEAGDAVLATNTSSLSVSEIAMAARRPDRVVGMHFFNPPISMRLVEVVPGELTGRDAVEAALDLARRMGRTPVEVADVPGFLANRLARPFTLEALRIVEDGQAEPEVVDRICRMGGGFRMGPFELMDLVGIDVNLRVARSFYEQSFGEPRWRPSPLQARLVSSGRLGRKSGRGWYRYEEGKDHRPPDPGPPDPSRPPTSRVSVTGRGPGTEALRQRLEEAGIELSEDAPLRLAGLEDRSLASAEPAAVGVCALVGGAPLAELTRTAATSDADAGLAEELMRSVGLHAGWVGDGPGLVLLRILAQAVNEAAFAIGAGIGDPEAADVAMRLGFNWPVGPVERGRVLGLRTCLDALDALRAETGLERYRAAPLLRARVAEGSNEL